jgi:hypothetical protein
VHADSVGLALGLGCTFFSSPSFFGSCHGRRKVNRKNILLAALRELTVLILQMFDCLSQADLLGWQPFQNAGFPFEYETKPLSAEFTLENERNFHMDLNLPGK